MKITAVMLILDLAGLCVFLWFIYRKEYARQWDEISRAAALEKDIDFFREHIQKLTTEYMIARAEMFSARTEPLKMQNKFSTLLCPRESHIWDTSGDIKQCRRCGIERRIDR